MTQICKESTFETMIRIMHVKGMIFIIIIFLLFSRIPTVAARKFIEPRHMTHTSDKWSRNKTAMIQHAFFNGKILKYTCD
jgi:hypothetical protein